jgi:type I restriction enzyme M protein
MLNTIKKDGRCGVVVPEGVLMRGTSAHKELRRQLVENNTVEAIMSLPGGVFQPYSGVKTSVIFFKKGGTTKDVLFLNVENDGYRMDSNHDTVVEEDDIPEFVDVFQKRVESLEEWKARDKEKTWAKNWWFVSSEKINESGFNLSASNYELNNTAIAIHASPSKILNELIEIEAMISEKLIDLKTIIHD